MAELFNNYFYEIAVALGFVLFLLMKRLKNYFYQKSYCKEIKYKVKVQKFVKFTRKLTKKHQEKIKELNKDLKWEKHYHYKYYEEITRFKDEMFKTKEIQDTINKFVHEKECNIRFETEKIRLEEERKIEEFIEKIVKIKNLDERFKLIVDQKGDNYTTKHEIIHSFLRETLLAFKQCEDEKEVVKAKLNLQVSANYSLVKKIEELNNKLKNINNFNK